jgi:predicted ATPase
MNIDLFVLISGCSGGGKSTLLTELGRRGYITVEEPGRRIVREEMLGNGLALPWVNGTAFARRAIALALADRATAIGHGGWVFFDRGLVDCGCRSPALNRRARVNDRRTSAASHAARSCNVSLNRILRL